MARKKIQSATDQRPFIMVYQDFLESDLLDNYYQKLVYIYLKKFADSNNQCFPSIKKLSSLTKIGTTKVKQTLAELEAKGVAHTCWNCGKAVVHTLKYLISYKACAESFWAVKLK